MRIPVELEKCLMCHDAPCTKECKALDPARLIRAVNFRNVPGAAHLMPDIKPCTECDAPCVYACPAKVDIPLLMNDFYQRRSLFMPLPDGEGIDLSCDLCGMKLENPFLLSSSVVASNYEMCARAFEMGWAGAAFKTVSLMDMHEASPRFSALKDSCGVFYGFKNIEQLSDHSLEENLLCFEELKRNYPTKVIIASIMGRNEEEWEYLARKVTEAGADVIELNFSCPNMEDKDAGMTIGQDPALVRRFTEAACRGTDKPVLAKMTPNLIDMCPPARAAMEGGAGGIAAINTISSITKVNLATLVPEPNVRGLSAVGGYSGPAVKPIALRFISDMYNDPQLKDAHISGMGGICDGLDAVEFLLMGAGSVQVTTAVMEYGYRIIDDLKDVLKYFMALHGFRKLSDFIGASSKTVVDSDEIERDTISYPVFHPEKCLGCGRCYLSCRDGGHQAISFDPETRRPKIDGEKCVGCHLCLLVCPGEAYSPSPKRVKAK